MEEIKIKNMKNIILAFILLFIYGTCYTQINTTIDIFTTSDEKINSISFFNLSQEKSYFEMEFTDSIRIPLSTVNDDIYNLWFVTDKKKYREQFLLGEGEIKIYAKISDNKLTIENVKGSDIYTTRKNYSKALWSLSSLSDSLFNLYHKELFLNNYESTFSIMIASNFVGKNQNNKSKLEWILKKMNDQIPSVKNHFLFDGVIRRANSLININKIELEDFEVIDIIGRKTNIEKSKHDFTILDFWFVQCPPCIKDHKALIKDYEKLVTNQDRIRIVGVSTDQDYGIWSNYLLKSNIPWENYLLDINNSKNLAEHLNISVFPTYLILGKNQEILMNTNSLKEMISFVNKSDNFN